MKNLDILNVFSRKQLHSVLTIMKIMKEHDLTEDDIKVRILQDVLSAGNLGETRSDANIEDLTSEEYDKLFKQVKYGFTKRHSKEEREAMKSEKGLQKVPCNSCEDKRKLEELIKKKRIQAAEDRRRLRGRNRR